jgi:hypothetical protein
MPAGSWSPRNSPLLSEAFIDAHEKAALVPEDGLDLGTTSRDLSRPDDPRYHGTYPCLWGNPEARPARTTRSGISGSANQHEKHQPIITNPILADCSPWNGWLGSERHTEPSLP